MSKKAHKEKVEGPEKMEINDDNQVDDILENTETASTEENCCKSAEDEIAAINLKYNEINDKYLRLSAEFDNYRKRTLKEKMELTKTAGENILKGILPVVDDFERGLSHVDDSKDLNAVKEGIYLIYNKFKDFLNQQGIKEIEAKELPFDTDLHEAITHIPASSPEMKGKVIECVEKGYMLHDKVLRFSKVVIAQ